MSGTPSQEQIDGDTRPHGQRQHDALARDRGCTKPGRTVPGYGCQVHHTNGWNNDGHTNIDEEVLACGPDNRLAEQGWTVTIRHGIAEWLPPPHLDTGHTRTNDYHHPQRLLAHPEPDETQLPNLRPPRPRASM